MATQVVLNSFNVSCESPNNRNNLFELVLGNLNVIPQSSNVCFQFLNSGFEVLQLGFCVLEALVKILVCLLQFVEAFENLFHVFLRSESFSLLCDLSESFLNPLDISFVLLYEVFNCL